MLLDYPFSREPFRPCSVRIWSNVISQRPHLFLRPLAYLWAYFLWERCWALNTMVICNNFVQISSNKSVPRKVEKEGFSLKWFIASNHCKSVSCDESLSSNVQTSAKSESFLICNCNLHPTSRISCHTNVFNCRHDRFSFKPVKHTRDIVF